MADVKITLNSITKTISVDSKKVKVSVSGKDKVKWLCHDGTFQITFKSGSDWPNPTTSGDAGAWKAESGPFTRPNTSLWYAVEAPGYTTLDPEIIIDP
jgi:hypothetical protein